MKVKDFHELVVYLYYDGNILYTITNGEKIYLCFLFNTEYINHPDYEHKIGIDAFLYVLTNQNDIEKLEKHLISLNEYFEIKCKQNEMYLVTHDFNYNEIDLSTLEPYTEFNASEVWESIVYLTYYLN